MTRIAIVGASARAAAFSAIRAELVPITADLFADADLTAVCDATRIEDYPHGFEPWLQRKECDAWMYTGGLENHPQLVDRLAAHRPLWGIGGGVLPAIRDPLQLQDLFAAAGLEFPETRARLVAADATRRWLSKPTNRGGGLGITRVPAGAFPATRGGRVFQEYIPGEPGSAVFVGHGTAARLLGVTRQLTRRDVTAVDSSDGGFEYAGSVGPWELPSDALRLVVSAGQRLVDRYALRGLFGIDFVLRDAQPVFLEVNPRYTASVEIVERSYGVDALALHADAFRIATWRDALVPPARSNSTHGKAILYARHATRFAWSLAELCSSLGSEFRDLQPADVPHPDTAIQSGHPVLTVFAKGTDVSDVTAQLSQRLALFERSIYAQ